MTPDKIGRYIINSELGRGGMATVFHASDPNFGRDVAIKILPKTFLHDPQFRVRFEREAKTIAALEHSAIVPVYDFGEDDGQPFIVMRLMSGGSLADKLENGSLSLEDSVKITTQLAPGLDAAHQSGIIHRDMKPGNILFDQYDNAYLSDFGIARLKEGDSTLTGTSILGTPAYMSPEQIQGGKDLDNRSDLYALGIMFYHMLVGHTPFQSDTPAKVMMMHILEPVPEIMDEISDAPPGLDPWLKKILAKEPDDRFGTAVEMANALQDAIKGKYPPSPRKTVVAPEWTTDAKQTIPISPVELSTEQVLTGAQAEITAVPRPKPQRSKLFPFIIGAAAIFGIGAIVVIGLVLTGLGGNGPLAMLAGPTATTIRVVVTEEPEDTPVPTSTLEPLIIEPTATDIPPTYTAVPDTSTPEPSPTEEFLTIGGADKIAFIDQNDIWVMNMDGTDIQQLTTDGAAKSNLEWKPDGSLLTFISGKCIYQIEYPEGALDFVACFESTEYIENFTFSPEGDRVAISIERQLFIVPFDLEKLQAVRTNADIRAMAECDSLNPITTFTGNPEHIKLLRWSNNGQRLIGIKIAQIGGIQGDLIQYMDFKSCDFPPDKEDEIPSSRFTMEGYDKNPKIQNFGYDGDSLLAMVNFVRNDGYGHLYLYNSNLHRVDAKANPIDGECCYRDVRFSPDGRYLIFAYQPYEMGAKATLYLIPYRTIGTGASYEPIPMPDTFFSNFRGKPSPALRPAQ